jgi:hypothetical protein
MDVTSPALCPAASQLLALVLTLGLLCQLVVPRTPVGVPTGEHRAVATASAEAGNPIARPRDTCQEALKCRAAARWAPTEGPPVEHAPPSFHLAAQKFVGSDWIEAPEGASLALIHLRANGSADAHGARA